MQRAGIYVRGYESMYQFTIDSSPLGRLTMASDGKNLTGLWIEGQKYFGAQNPFIGSNEIGEERQLPVVRPAKGV